jgi:hypothetical protein
LGRAVQSRSLVHPSQAITSIVLGRLPMGGTPLQTGCRVVRRRLHALDFPRAAGALAAATDASATVSAKTMANRRAGRGRTRAR